VFVDKQQATIVVRVARQSTSVKATQPSTRVSKTQSKQRDSRTTRMRTNARPFRRVPVARITLLRKRCVRHSASIRLLPRHSRPVRRLRRNLSHRRAWLRHCWPVLLLYLLFSLCNIIEVVKFMY